MPHCLLTKGQNRHGAQPEPRPCTGSVRTEEEASVARAEGARGSVGGAGAERRSWGSSMATGKTLALTLSKMEPQEGSEQERDFIGFRFSRDPSGCL